VKPRLVCITGATSGFGRATAERFAREGWAIFITGRRADRLQQINQQLLALGASAVHQLCFDVRSRESVHAAWNSLSEEWKAIDVLVNNAGLALGKEPIHEADVDDWEQMIDTNIKGFLYVSKVVSASMVARKSGTIIHVGSIAGREAYAGGNVYSATKFAVDALTKSMRIDLAPYGIRVGQIAPGAADTEFSLVRFHGNAEKAKLVYQGFEPLLAQDIADAIWFMASRPSHVCIQDMLIMPTAQPNASTIHRNSTHP
jgi:3-hydroxy acid dehydrogenase / malonic semialdehyde reductase